MKILKILIITLLITLSIFAFACIKTAHSTFFAPTVSASPGTVNQGQTSVLSNSSSVTTGTSPYVYQWLQKAPGANGFSSISGATSNIYNFTTSGSTTTGVWTFELQITDAASVMVTSTAVSVRVNVALTIGVSPISWIMDVGQSKTFSATPSGGSGSYIGYQWYVGGFAQSGSTGSVFSFVPGSSGSYPITVTVTDSLGATSAKSSDSSVTVSASPSVSVTPVGPVTLDVGQVQVFTASPSGGSGVLFYQWFLDGSAVGGDSVSYFFSAGGDSHLVTCRVTDSASTPVMSPVSNAVSVKVNSALFAPTVSASPGTVNQGQTSVLSNSSSVTTGTSPYVYQWLQKAPGANGFSSISGATSNIYNFTTSNATPTDIWNFILQVKDDVGAIVNSSEVSVIVNIPPLDHFVFSSVGKQTAGTSFNITITAEDSSNNTSTNYVGTNTMNISFGTISPAVTGVFSSGVWSGSVTVTGAGSVITLFTIGSNMSGTSNSFTVNPGDLNNFVFNTISNPQTAGSSFSITVTAKDSYGNDVTDYVNKPYLTCSTGSISPGTMNAFVNGVGSTLVVVTGAVFGVTITATDGSHSGTSNPFMVLTTPSPTPTNTLKPTPTLTSTLTPTSTPSPTLIPKATPIPTSTALPSPASLTTTLSAEKDGSSLVELVFRGNVSISQMSNVTIISNHLTVTTTVSFTITGPNATIGFSNMTIPKTAVSYGTNPITYIDGKQATTQGYAEDANNFYIWYSTRFSTHQVKIQFAVPLTSHETSFGSVLAVGVIVPEIILIYAVIAVRRLRRKPDKT